jgi:excisionase family DNA binding protein
MSMMTTELMTRQQAADRLHLSLSTVNRMCSDGRLTIVRPSGAEGGRVFVTAESVNKALTPVITKAQTTHPEGETA